MSFKSHEKYSFVFNHVIEVRAKLYAEIVLDFTTLTANLLCRIIPTLFDSEVY